MSHNAPHVPKITVFAAQDYRDFFGMFLFHWLQKWLFLQHKTPANFLVLFLIRFAGQNPRDFFNIFDIKVRGFTTHLTLNESKDGYGAQLPAEPFKTPLTAGQNSREISNLHFLSSKRGLCPQMP